MRIEMLRDFPWRWALWWVLVPNLAFIAMWPIGGPSMAAPMLFCGALAVLASHWTNRAMRIAVAMLIFVLNLMCYMSLSFNLGVFTLVQSVQFLPDLNPLKSPEYLVAGLLLSGTLALLLARAPRAPALRTRDHKLLGLALVALLINVDGMATAGTRGSYKMSAPAGTPIDSAILRTHITPATVPARNLVVILVESWGNPSDPGDRALFHRLWNPSRWNARYEVTSGVTAYYGSTTNAEVREWCGAWADYESFDFDNSNCLPEQFRSAGFETVAMHSFEGTFFDRNAWYPKIGFDKIMFGPDLIKRGTGSCGGVFPGACDRDVPKVIGNVLRENPAKRKLVYWLTVNGHLPLPANESLDTDHCTLGNAQWREDYAMLCRTYEVQRQLADSLTDEVMNPAFPDADILIVGDHMPPFFPRYLRTRFDAEHVPWILLRNRPSAPGQPKAKPAIASAGPVHPAR